MPAPEDVLETLKSNLFFFFYSRYSEIVSILEFEYTACRYKCI